MKNDFTRVLEREMQARSDELDRINWKYSSLREEAVDRYYKHDRSISDAEEQDLAADITALWLQQAEEILNVCKTDKENDEE